MNTGLGSMTTGLESMNTGGSHQPSTELDICAMKDIFANNKQLNPQLVDNRRYGIHWIEGKPRICLG